MKQSLKILEEDQQYPVFRIYNSQDLRTILRSEETREFKKFIAEFLETVAAPAKVVQNIDSFMKSAAVYFWVIRTNMFGNLAPMDLRYVDLQDVLNYHLDLCWNLNLRDTANYEDLPMLLKFKSMPFGDFAACAMHAAINAARTVLLSKMLPALYDELELDGYLRFWVRESIRREMVNYDSLLIDEDKGIRRAPLHLNLPLP